MHRVPAQHTTAPLSKSLSGHSHCSAESLSILHTPPLQRAKSLSHSWLVAACLCLTQVQIESLSLWHSPGWRLLLQLWVCCLLCVCVCVCVWPGSPDFVCPSHSRSGPGPGVSCPGRKSAKLQTFVDQALHGCRCYAHMTYLPFKL